MGKGPGELSGADPLDLTNEPLDAEFDTADQSLAEGTYTGSVYADGVTPAVTDSSNTFGSDYGAEYATDYESDPADAVEDPDIVAQREEIERTRSEMSSTLDAIQEKLTPQHIAGQAKEAMHDATVGRAQEAVSTMTDTVQSAVSDVSGSVQNAVQNVTGSTSSMGGTIVEVIRENPIPAALAGVGLGWLFMSVRNRSSSSSSSQGTGSGYYPRYEDSSQRYAYGSPYVEAETRYYGNQPPQGSSGDGGAIDRVQGKVGDVASQAQSTVSNVTDKAQDAVSQVGDTATQVASQAQQTAGQVAQGAQQTAGQLATGAQYGAQRAGSEMDRLMRERPLAVGLGAFALGLTVGLAIPESQKEVQLLGDARDSLVDRAQQAVQQTAGKVSTVAEQTLDAAKQSAQQAAQDQGLAGSSGQSGAQESSSQSTSSRSTSKK